MENGGSRIYSLESLREQLAVEKENLNLTKARIIEIRDQINAKCPVVAGARVPITGYSYQDREMIVERVNWSGSTDYGNVPGWVLYGKVVKMNGEKGKQPAVSFVSVDGEYRRHL